MIHPLTFYLTTISFLISLKVSQSFGKLVLLREPPTGNSSSANLTCVSEDDGAALIWNYYYNVYDHSNGWNISTDFEPKKPASKKASECALWNSTGCFGKWESSKDWDLVDSAIRPMAPVFDYRWEGFGEIFSDPFKHHEEYHYVREVKESSGTVVFSARGPRDVYIFLCQHEDPEKGPCFWIIIGSLRGQQSEIRNCGSGTLRREQYSTFEQCKDVVSRGAATIIDAYEWRTFRLEWSTENKTIKIFNSNNVHPFLEGALEKWHPVSHLLVANTGSRIRFHFYEYFVTKERKAVLSTTEFLHQDKDLCLELMVGLCPKCRLNVTLVNSGYDIPIKSISGMENSGLNDLLTWRSVRLNASSLDLNSKSMKLKLVTILNNDRIEGRWAIDNFRTCEPVGGLRKSTIPIHRTSFPSAISLWPKVKCQKLSYTGNTVVDSPLRNPYLFGGASNKRLFERTPGKHWLTVNLDHASQAGGDDIGDHQLIGKRDTAATNKELIATPVILSGSSEVITHTEYNKSVLGNAGGSLLGRKVHGRYRRDFKKCDVYELDTEAKTISIRLEPPDPNHHQFDSYSVSVRDGSEYCEKRFPVLNGKLECRQGYNAICFENLTIGKEGWSREDNRLLSVEVYGNTIGEQVSEKVGQCRSDWGSANKDSSKPEKLTLIHRGHGTVKLNWTHPLFPNTKIDRFEIRVQYLTTRLLKTGQAIMDQVKNYSVARYQKDYETEFNLSPSTKYEISVTAVNQHGPGSPVLETGWTPSSIAFESGEELSATQNRTWIEFQVPAVINATKKTSVTVTVEGSLTCKQGESPSTPAHTSIGKTWVVAKYEVIDEAPKRFNISDNYTDAPKLTCSLHPGYSYRIKANATDKYSKESVTITWPVITLAGGDSEASTGVGAKQNLGWLVIFPILAIILLLLIVWHRKRKRSSTRTSQKKILRIKKTEHSTPPSTVKRSTPPSDSMKNRMSIESERSTPDVVPSNPHSSKVDIDQFEEYTKDALASGLLKKQYETISKCPTKPRENGILPENIAKNRYQDLIAYDHSRVILENISGDPHSDYINANYIKGYRKERAYIATQGPKFNTVKDFWRMIWQEKVMVICMLANVKEGKKKKCEKYWPDVGTKVKYGDIFIANTNHKVFADYTVRTFTVARRKENRTITHLHYTGWPDHGVPMYTQSLVSYIKKLRDTKPGEGPVVVHCSAGVGRTGTIILCDICLNQANEEKFVDLMATTMRMREDRANMVDTKQQYLLAHLTIVESRISTETQIPCTLKLPAEVNEMKKRLITDIERLDEIVWQERALHDIAEPRRPVPAEEVEDGVAEPLEDSLDPPWEQPSTFGIGNNYINAVSVDGVKMKRQYLACRLPSTSTLSDFWRLIAEQEIELVVILQPPGKKDPKFCDIMPNGPSLVPVPHIQVETKASLVEEAHFSVNKLLLTDTSVDEVEPQPVTMLTCNGWKCRKDGKPPAVGALVELWRASEKISRKERPTLVLCRDGVTGCGLYLALSFLLERMSVETECDVISAVRAVRRSQPDFVKSTEQFQYLYDAAINYHECFKTYANFS